MKAAYYATLTHGDRSAFKRWVHKNRHAHILQLLKPGDKVLDYGAGDGFFYKLAQPRVKQIVAYEPWPDMFVSCYHDIVALLNDHRGTFSKIVCMDVCEHLKQKELDLLFANIRAAAADSCEFIFEVPVETGLSGSAKNLFRYLRRSEVLAVSEVIRPIFGLPIARRWEPGDWTSSHLGFSHHEFRKTLERAGFTILRQMATPLGGPSWVNNAVLLICN